MQLHSWISPWHILIQFLWAPTCLFVCFPMKVYKCKAGAVLWVWYGVTLVMSSAVILRALRLSSQCLCSSENQWMSQLLCPLGWESPWTTRSPALLPADLIFPLWNETSNQDWGCCVVFNSPFLGSTILAGPKVPAHCWHVCLTDRPFPGLFEALLCHDTHEADYHT